MKKICEQAALYFYNELDTQQRATFAAHLPDCPACQKQLAFLAQMQEALVPPAAPQAVVDRVLQTRPVPIWKRVWKPVLTAVCLIWIGVYTVPGLLHAPTGQTDDTTWLAYLSDEADEDYQNFVLDFESFEAEF